MAREQAKAVADGRSFVDIIAGTAGAGVFISRFRKPWLRLSSGWNTIENTMSLRSFNNDQFDQSRQFLLDRRCERNHPKRHRTQKRAKAIGKAKRERIKATVTRQLIARRRWLEQARAYWSGEANGHPA